MYLKKQQSHKFRFHCKKREYSRAKILNKYKINYTKPSRPSLNYPEKLLTINHSNKQNCISNVVALILRIYMSQRITVRIISLTNRAKEKTTVNPNFKLAEHFNIDYHKIFRNSLLISFTKYLYTHTCRNNSAEKISV